MAGAWLRSLQGELNKKQQLGSHERTTHSTDSQSHLQYRYNRIAPNTVVEKLEIQMEKFELRKNVG